MKATVIGVFEDGSGEIFTISRVVKASDANSRFLTEFLAKEAKCSMDQCQEILVIDGEHEVGQRKPLW